MVYNLIKYYLIKFKAKKIFEKTKILTSDNDISERLLNDIYFGEYIDLVEEIENNLDFKEDNKFLIDGNGDKKIDSKNIISSEFYKFLVNSSKKRNKQYNKSMIFYNSLSLIMLSMLTGGLIGVVLIVYYSLKPEDTDNSFNIPL